MVLSDERAVVLSDERAVVLGTVVLGEVLGERRTSRSGKNSRLKSHRDSHATRRIHSLLLTRKYVALCAGL